MDTKDSMILARFNMIRWSGFYRLKDTWKKMQERSQFIMDPISMNLKQFSGDIRKILQLGYS